MIKVPLAAPQNAAVVNESRLFRDAATGQINALQNGLPTRCILGHSVVADADDRLLP